MSPNSELAGKVAIVTGAGKPDGIGQATALELARRGAAVVVTDLARTDPRHEFGGRPTAAEDARGLEQAVGEIEAAGVRGLSMPVDVTSEAEIASCVSRAVEELGGVDILFNNAGTPVGARPFFELTDEIWDLSWRVNVMGMVYFCRAVVPEMRARGGGSIVNNASLAGLRATEDFAAYTTTKFAVIGLTKSLALDLAPDGIRVNAVCPGYIDTPMTRVAEAALLDETGSPERVRPDQHEIPLGRPGAGDDVGEVVAWLSGPGARYVTGVSISVDGGWREGL